MSQSVTGNRPSGMLSLLFINRLTLVLTASAAFVPLRASAHLLDGSPDPLPRWVPIVALIIVGIMGGTVGFAISKHRASMEKQKKQKLQCAAEAVASPAKEQPPAKPQ